MIGLFDFQSENHSHVSDGVLARMITGLALNSGRNQRDDLWLRRIEPPRDANSRGNCETISRLRAAALDFIPGHSK
jgi:hypothetical protein